MLKSALITAATAIAITTGVLGASSASAETYRGPSTMHAEHRGDSWKRGDHARGPVRICEPVVRTVKVRGYHGWQFKRIAVGERCHSVRRGW